MKTTHTPGPWEVRHGSGIDFTIRTDDFGMICKGVFPSCDSETMDEHEMTWKANANLIAAAPDLLEACKAIITNWENGNLAEAANMCRKAIQKATDEDQTEEQTNSEMLGIAMKTAIQEQMIAPYSVKTPEEISKLKEDWLKDPCWDIYSTQGFERYQDELKDFQEQREHEWKVNENERLTKKADQLRCSVPVVRELERLESVRKDLQQQMDKFMQMEFPR
jgi:hypothetical protein